MRRALPFAALVVLVAGFLWALRPVEPEKKRPLRGETTVVVTDMAGRTVAIPKSVQRIVLLRSLGIYELAVVLGDEVGQKLIAWDTSLQTGDRDCHEELLKRFPRLEGISLLGDVLRETLSAEAVLALKPDLVIANTYMLERQSKVLEQLERADLPLVYLDYSDPLRDPQKCLLLLGRILDAQDRAQTAVDWIDKKLNVVRDRLEAIKVPVQSIYMEAGTQGPQRYGNTFGSNERGKLVNWSSIMSQLRSRNIATGSVSGAYGMGQIRPEFLIANDPDVIVITGANWSAFPDSLRLGYDADTSQAQAALQGYTSRPGWETLTAVKNGRVHALHTRLGGHVMSFAAAEQLAQWLYPDEFTGLDPEASLREFYDQFMPIPFRGTWMTSLKTD